MTVRQAQVVEGVVGVVLVVMMHLYHVLCREAQSIVRAAATLSIEKSHDPSWLGRVVPQPG